MSSEPQISPRQAAKTPKADPAIYLRAYDVINSLDRAERTPWWERALGIAAKVGLTKASGGLPDPAEAAKISPASEIQSTFAIENQPSLVRARTAPAVVEPAPLKEPFSQDGRSVSWVLLVVVAMITAGLTFAVVHFAWASLTAHEGWPPAKHIPSYVSSRSALGPESFLLLKAPFNV